MVDNVTMSVITTISSMSVKPAADRYLPVTILRSIESRTLERRADVEDVLPAPMRAIRIVLIGAERPVRILRHRINRNPSEKLELSAGRVVGRRNAIHQLLKV